MEEWITFETQSESLRGYLVRPAGRPPWPALLIIHPVTGVTGHVRDVVRSYAADGYLALAPDLYTNDVDYPKHDVGDINEAAHMGPNTADWDAHLARFAEPQRSRVLAARKWISGRPPGGYLDEVKAAFEYLTHRPDVSVVGSIGYCMGGRLTAALAALGVELAAGVIYYGGSPKADEVAKIRCPLEGHYGVTDVGITGKVYEFARAMKAAGLHFAYCVYDADHGFNDPTAHAWNAQAAQQARERASAFLAKHLKVGVAV
jgi:carboxymethylenebutenolidase